LGDSEVSLRDCLYDSFQSLVFKLIIPHRDVTNENRLTALSPKKSRQAGDKAGGRQSGD